MGLERQSTSLQRYMGKLASRPYRRGIGSALCISSDEDCSMDCEERLYNVLSGSAGKSISLNYILYIAKLYASKTWNTTTTLDCTMALRDPLPAPPYVNMDDSVPMQRRNLGHTSYDGDSITITLNDVQNVFLVFVALFSLARGAQCIRILQRNRRRSPWPATSHAHAQKSPARSDIVEYAELDTRRHGKIFNERLPRASPLGNDVVRRRFPVKPMPKDSKIKEAFTKQSF